MSASDNALKSWLSRRTAGWRRLQELNSKLGGGRAGSPADAMEVVDGYYATAHDLSLARRVMPGSRTASSLEVLYTQLHTALHRPPRRFFAALLRLLREEIPDVAFALRHHIAWVTALFVLSALAGWWMIATFPELIGLFAHEGMIETVERGVLWTDGLLNVIPSAALSIGLLANNIAVTLTAFTVGILFGLGTFYIIALNGLMLGGIFAFTAQHGLAGELLRFVIAHGPVELSVICIAGAAGAGLGEALVRPGAATRREAFQAASGRIGRMMVLCALLLIGCGFIEGYISPDPSYPMAARVALGVCFWLVMIGALTGDLFGRRRARKHAGG
jgi:uncharacterized membrane protein SpoIIM required for sporulation